jgi:hypothetical protein
MVRKRNKLIQVSERNYLLLRDLGNITDTFDGVLTRILELALPLIQKQYQRNEGDLSSLELSQSHPHSYTTQSGRCSPG